MGVGVQFVQTLPDFLPFSLPFCHAFLPAFLPSFVRLAKVPEGKDGGRPSFITALVHFELNK